MNEAVRICSPFNSECVNSINMLMHISVAWVKKNECRTIYYLLIRLISL